MSLHNDIRPESILDTVLPEQEGFYFVYRNPETGIASWDTGYGVTFLKRDEDQTTQAGTTTSGSKDEDKPDNQPDANCDHECLEDPLAEDIYPKQIICPETGLEFEETEDSLTILDTMALRAACSKPTIQYEADLNLSTPTKLSSDYGASKDLDEVEFEALFDDQVMSMGMILPQPTSVNALSRPMTACTEKSLYSIIEDSQGKDEAVVQIARTRSLLETIGTLFSGRLHGDAE